MEQLDLGCGRLDHTKSPIGWTTIVVGLLLALAGTACSKSQANTTVVVTVLADPSIPAVSQLQAVWTNAGSFGSESIPRVNAGTPIAFDPSFAITLSGSWTGQLNVAVIAFDATATAVASGTAIVDVVPGGSASVTMQLAAIPPKDAGSPDDVLDEALDAGTIQVLDAGLALDNAS